MTVKIYGIKNCDTMKKAFKWLDQNDVPYEFHDYKKHGADENIVAQAIAEHGWENVINRRGTTWRKLPEDTKNTMNEQSAIKVAINTPSIIKRPLLAHKDHIYLGFEKNTYNNNLLGEINK